MINAAQIRAARAITRENQSEFSNNCGISVPLLKMIELEEAGVTLKTAEKIIAYMEAKNYEFTEDGGIRPTYGRIKTYQGQEGFRAFYDDIYKVASEVGGDISMFSGSPEKLLSMLGQDWYALHVERMVKIADKFSFRIILPKMDTVLLASKFAQYRGYQYQEDVQDSVVAYGDRTAFIKFADKDSSINVLYGKNFSLNIQAMFNMTWDSIGRQNEQDIEEVSA